jgi:hypothetical protein
MKKEETKESKRKKKKIDFDGFKLKVVRLIFQPQTMRISPGI